MDFPVLLVSSPWREVLLDDVEPRLVLDPELEVGEVERVVLGVTVEVEVVLDT